MFVKENPDSEKNVFNLFYVFYLKIFLICFSLWDQFFFLVAVAILEGDQRSFCKRSSKQGTFTFVKHLPHGIFALCDEGSVQRLLRTFHILISFLMFLIVFWSSFIVLH